MTAEALENIIIAEIEKSTDQRITFADYMDLVLYHQDYGYYNSGTVSIGSKGDFFTSPSLGQDFGELLGIQFRQMWQNLGCQDRFCLVEMGAGNGELAQDILGYIQKHAEDDFKRALKYIIVERSPALIQLQQEKLASSTINLTWKTWSNIADESIVGCFFSNELVDAFPVHLVTKDEGQLQEIYLCLEEGQLTETTNSISSQQINQYFDSIAINLLARQYPTHYRTEVNLQALDWMQTVGSKLKQGYVLTIDYGYIADKYYHPSRDRGTLQCYFQHRRHNNPYANLGYQDITAHIDFTSLMRCGESSNLTTLGFTQQGLFLMALGLGDRLNELSSGKYNITEIFKRRDALHQLINPTGLGNFGVLIQGKNLTAREQSLKGLFIPKL